MFDCVALQFVIHIVQVRSEPGDFHKSPFYKGHTTYGGRAAYRQSGSGDYSKVLSFTLLFSVFASNMHDGGILRFWGDMPH